MRSTFSRRHNMNASRAVRVGTSRQNAQSAKQPYRSRTISAGRTIVNKMENNMLSYIEDSMRLVRVRSKLNSPIGLGRQHPERASERHVAWLSRLQTSLRTFSPSHTSDNARTARRVKLTLHGGSRQLTQSHSHDSMKENLTKLQDEARCAARSRVSLQQVAEKPLFVLKTADFYVQRTGHHG
jgi:hypothetical protein